MKNYNISMVSRIRHFILSRIKRKHFKSCGAGLSFSPENSTFRYNSIQIGDNVFIGKDAIFSCEAEIGNYVLFGPRVYITSGRHDYSKIGKRIREQGETGVKKVRIEDDCWIGEGSLITRGVVIGEGTVVGGMSVVSKSLAPYCICVGSPCKPIRARYNDEELRQHLRLLSYSEDKIELMIKRRKDELEKSGFYICDNGIINSTK